MKPAIEFAARALDLGLLRTASLLVPVAQREEWLCEWRGELWQARHECAYTAEFSWASERAIARFCMGAFNDAICLRQLDRHTPAPHTVQFGAAWQCILLLAALLGAGFMVAQWLPGVRAMRSMPKIPARSGLVLIEDANNEDSPPTISSGQYRAWKDRKQEFFDGFAFYRVTKEKVNWQPVLDGSHESAGWGVGRASSNFFTLLGLPVRFAGAEVNFDGDVPGVILSESVWKRQFGANPNVAGSVVQLGLRQARVVGVAPEGPSGLPGRVDAWLLEPDTQMVPGGAGYVVAHLTPSGKSMMQSPRIQITSYAPHRTPDDMLGIALGGDRPGPREIFRFAAILALLALPAVSSVALGEYSLSLNEIPWSRRLYRWAFLGAKISLLLPIVYFASLDLAYGFTGFNTSHSLYVQLVTTFFGCLFGISWALNDQRRRCPVCLRRVAHPARVGQFSRTFLAWSGTEMMCMGGHTLLHVPSLPTSWFSTQRWMFLDPSWKFLFAGPARDPRFQVQ